MRRWALGLAALSVALAWPAAADPVRTLLQRSELPATAQAATLGHVLLKAGDPPAWHTHAGIETGYILTGRTLLSIAGRPDVTLGPGQTFLVPRGIAHAARAVGGDATLVAIWVIDAGAPLATPAAAPSAAR